MFNKLKRQVISVLAGAAVVISAAGTVPISAAEPSTAPWGFYTVSASEWDDMSQWNKLSQKIEGYRYYGEGDTGDAPIIRMRDDVGRGMQIVPDSDAGAIGIDESGEDFVTNRGSLIVAFTVPYTGDWIIDAKCQSSDAGSGTGTAGYMSMAVVSEGTSVMLGDSETAIPGGAAETNTAQLTKEAAVAKGEIIALRVRSTSDSYARSFYFDYVITDADNPESEYNVISSGTGYKKPLNNDRFSPASNISDMSNDDVWSVFYAKDIDLEDVYDISDWVEPAVQTVEGGYFKIENADTPKTQTMLSKGFSNGGFRINPSGRASGHQDYPNIRCTTVIAWTAPSAGDYAIDFSGKNIGSDVITSERTKHMLGYSKQGETILNELESFEIAGSASGEVTSKQWIYSVDAGETIYLLSDAGTDAYGDRLILNFEITDTESGHTWDFAEYKSERLDPSDFYFFTSGLNTVNTFQFNRAKFTQDGSGNIIASATGNESGSCMIINNDRSIKLRPAVGERTSVNFDIPEDGYYKIEVQTENNDSSDQSGLTIGLYKNSPYDIAISSAEIIAEETLDNNESKTISEVCRLFENDRIWLTAENRGAAEGAETTVRYIITKIDKVSVSYSSDGELIENVSEISGGAALQAEVTYIPDNNADISVVLAAYDENARLISVAVEEVSVTAQTPNTILVRTFIPADSSTSRVKTFFLDSLKTMTPIEDTDVI